MESLAEVDKFSTASHRDTKNLILVAQASKDMSTSMCCRLRYDGRATRDLTGRQEQIGKLSELSELL